jgi:methylated-DNA-protein-cysteine methyltransferase related protein
MAVNIVRTIIRKFLNPADPHCAKTETKSHLANMTKKPVSPRSSLKKIQPSGKTDLSFFEQVYQVARLIPEGRVTTYGAIAAALGTKGSARMVGWAMNQAHQVHPPIPAHRVINRNGMLSGKHHFSSPTHMQTLLEKEQIRVVNDVVQDFASLFWDPVTEL